MGVAMIVSLFIALSWLLVASSAALAIRMYRIEFAFVFLLVNFANTNLYYLMGDNFHIFEISEDPKRYLSFALIQSVIVPLFSAVMIHQLLRTSSISRKAAIFLTAFVLLIGTEALSVLTHIVVYDRLRVFLWLTVYRLLLLILPLFALRYFRRMCSYS